MSLRELIEQGASTKAFFNKHSPVGSKVVGTIVSTDVRQVRDPETNDLKFWDDGNPRQQVVVVLDTDLRDDGPDDDGRRAVFIKWWGDQRRALLDAVKDAGDDDLHVGGKFAAEYYGDGEQPKNKVYSPAKLYRFDYVKPSPTAGLLNQPAETAAAPPAAAPAAAAPTPPPAAAAATPTSDPAEALQKVKQLIALGLDDGAIANALNIGVEAVAAIRQLPA